MLTLFILMPTLLALLAIYTGIGMKVARNQYALQMANYNSLGQQEIKNLLEQKKAEQKALSHRRGICNMEYANLSSRGCDCPTSKTWWALKREIDKLSCGVVPEPKIPSVMDWPKTATLNYIKGGEYKPKGYDPLLTAKLEKELL